MTYEKNSSRKNNDLTKFAFVLSLGLIASAMIVRNGFLKTDSGRYQMPSDQLASQCMLFDTKSGNCYGVVDGEISRFNLRKTKYKDKSDLTAESLSGKVSSVKSPVVANPPLIAPSELPLSYPD